MCLKLCGFYGLQFTVAVLVLLIFFNILLFLNKARNSIQNLLFTIAVGKIDAIAACWGSNCIESSRRAGYIPSVRVI